MKNLIKIFIFQIVYGALAFLGCMVLNVFFESSMDVILFISSVVSLILSFILYKWFLKKYLLSEFNKSRKKIFFMFFIYSIVISAISVLGSAVEIDALNVLSACLQQSYYLVSEFFGENENCTLITCIAFIVENIIKMIILLPKKKNTDNTMHYEKEA